MLIFWAEVVAVSKWHEHEAFLVGEDISDHLQSVQLRPVPQNKSESEVLDRELACMIRCKTSLKHARTSAHRPKLQAFPCHSYCSSRVLQLCSSASCRSVEVFLLGEKGSSALMVAE
jgi:hypothetical protein